jgi:hypothetical protein
MLMVSQAQWVGYINLRSKDLVSVAVRASHGIAVEHAQLGHVVQCTAADEQLCGWSFEAA